MLLDRSLQRLAVLAAAAVTILGLRLIPAPAPARADVCSVPGISTACSVASGVASGVSAGAGAIVSGVSAGVSWTWNKATGAVAGIVAGTKWTFNVGTGWVRTAAGPIGKVIAGPLGKLSCKVIGNVGEGWWGKVCNLAKGIFAKAQSAAGKVKSKLPGATGGGGGGGTSASTAAGQPQDSPQSYLRTSAIAAGAAFFAGEIAHVISKGTSADVTAPWYRQLYGRVAGFAAGVALLALLVALAEGASFGDGALIAAALRAVPYAAIMTFAASSLVMSALAIVDAASAQIAGPSMREVTHVLHIAAALFAGLGLVAKGSAIGAAHGGAAVKLGMIAKLAAFPAAMFAIFGAIATAAVAAELLLREVAIYACVLFLPLILAARIWPRLRHAGERLGRVLAAVIVSKLVLVVTLAMLAGAILHGGLSGLAVGIAGLFAVALAPAMFYGLFVLADHGFTRSTLPVPQPMSAADRMAEVVGWHTTQVEEVRGVAYAAAPESTPEPAPPSTPPSTEGSTPSASAPAAPSARREAGEEPEASADGSNRWL